MSEKKGKVVIVPVPEKCKTSMYYRAMLRFKRERKEGKK